MSTVYDGGGGGTADVSPSGSGTMRGNDIVSERDGVLISPLATVAGAAASFVCVQLLNAAASGRRLLIDGIFVLGSTHTHYEIRSHNVALLVDEGAWMSVNPAVAAGNAHVFSDTLGAFPGTAMYQLAKDTIAEAQHYMFPFPIMLDEDEGIVVCNPHVFGAMRINFVGREV